RKIRIKPDMAVERHDTLPSLWARARVKQLMNEEMGGLQDGTTSDVTKTQITQLGLDYDLVTQFTSFVAVDELSITSGGKPKTGGAPVEMPEGVSYEGVFGGTSGAGGTMAKALPRFQVGQVAPSPAPIV